MFLFFKYFLTQQFLLKSENSNSSISECSAFRICLADEPLAGFTVSNMYCIPPNKTISAALCYKMDREQVYAAIRDAGILLYEKKGMISFCPEQDKGRPATAMLKK